MMQIKKKKKRKLYNKVSVPLEDNYQEDALRCTENILEYCWQIRLLEAIHESSLVLLKAINNCTSYQTIKFAGIFPRKIFFTYQKGTIIFCQFWFHLSSCKIDDKLWSMIGEMYQKCREIML